MENNESWGSVLLHETNTFIKNPCFISQVVVTPKSNKRCNIHIYDSIGSTDNEVIDIGTPQGTSKSINYPKPLRFNNGVYIVFDGDTVSVQVIFKGIYIKEESLE